MMPRVFDIVIIGGGPAGTATAIHLVQEGLSVLVLEASSYDRRRHGETLPPTITARLKRLNVLESFLREGSRPAAGIVSVWGSPRPHVNDFLFGVQGSGWQVDRSAFDKMLADHAVTAGAALWTSSRLLSGPLWNGKGWAFHTRHQGRQVRCVCRFLVDATGRSGTPWLAHLSPRIVFDRLIGIAWIGKRSEEWPYTVVEAAEEGWFYCATLPGKLSTIIYLTDSDIYRSKVEKLSNFWWHQLSRTSYSRQRLPKAADHSRLQLFSAASSVRMDAAGDGWCAVGDSAFSYDPLSGLGVQHALDSATRAAPAIKSFLDRNQPMDAYVRWVNETFQKYVSARQRYYTLEARWLGSPFWQRRAQFPIFANRAQPLK
jgi:flavin-dependent dehydrogenase